MLLSTGVISTVLMMNQLFEFIPFLQSTGVELNVIAKMILFSLPPVLMISVPVSLLIGIYAGISRLSSDSELIVMRASGVSLSFFFRPVLMVASVVALFVMLQSFYLSPIGVKNMAELKFNLLKKQTRLNLQVGQINNFFGQKLIYIFGKKGELFEGIFISDWKSDRNSGVIEAKTGKIYLDEKNHKIVFRLHEGKIHTVLEDDGYRIVEFDQLDYSLVPPKSERKNIPHRFKKEQGPGEKQLDTELSINELVAVMNKVPKNSSDYFQYREEFHGRIVAALACLCFAIFALPMGIYNPRSPKAGNIVYMITVLLVYFLIYAHIRNLLSKGETSPPVLYLALVFIIANGLVKYLKINLNIDSIFQYFLEQRKKKIS